MPISKENKALYPADWRQISKRIRERDGQRCKRCRAPNRTPVARGSGSDAGTYMLENGDVFDAETGESLGCARGSEFESTHTTIIVLTVAHVDQDPANNTDDNLAALCQRCHLKHDQVQHIVNSRATRRKRKAAGNLPGIQ